MYRVRALPFIALVVLPACTSADILRLDQTPRPQTSPSAVQLLGQEPSRPYKVIAIVSARSNSLSAGDLDRVRARLVKEAAQLGGHAILLDSSSLTRVGGDENQRQQITGKVIVYTDSTTSH